MEGWFTEKCELWPGQAFSLEIEEVLCDMKSKFQHIQVFKTKNYGNALVLDGIIQVTERDEFSYQEMIAHLPLNCHPNPKNVLVIGGGDGGVLREIVKHPSVETVVLCEIDGDVIEVSKKFLPFMSVGYEHPKVSVVVEDGFKYLKEKIQSFDVIITDSSDPVGPAESLFQKEFFTLMRNSLKEGGIICTQGECVWLHLNIIKQVLSFCKETFPVVDFAYTCIPTYPSGQIGFVICGLSPEYNFRKPLRQLSEEVQNNLKYYSPEIHSAAFVLPQFAKKALEN